MPAKPLTTEQKADAERLKKAFKDWQIARKLQGQPSSQEAAGALLGINQSAMNQYLGGKIPLNASFLANVAALFEIPGELISPTLANEAKRISEVIGSGASVQVPNVANVQASIGPAPTTVTIGPFVGLNTQVAKLRVEGIPDAAVAMIEAAVAGAQVLTEAMAAKVAADRQTDAKLAGGDSDLGDAGGDHRSIVEKARDDLRSAAKPEGERHDKSGNRDT